MTPFDSKIHECDAAILLPPYDTNKSDSDESVDASPHAEPSTLDAESVTLLLGAVNEQVELLMVAILAAHKAGLPIRVEADYEACRVAYRR